VKRIQRVAISVLATLALLGLPRLLSFEPVAYTGPSLIGPTPTAVTVPLVLTGAVLVSSAKPRCHYQLTQDGVALSDPVCTPGSANPNLTLAILCSPSFRTTPYRTGALSSPAPVTARQKTAAYTRYGVSQAQRDLKDPNDPKRYMWEVDHQWSLEDLGDNSDSNLWPQPSRMLKLSYDDAGHLVVEMRLSRDAQSPGYEDKDVVENQVHDDMCAGLVSEDQGHETLSGDWAQRIQQSSAPAKQHTSDDD
jgi:hypothetical protein